MNRIELSDKELEKYYRKLKKLFNIHTKELARYIITIDLYITEEIFDILVEYIREVKKEKIMLYMVNSIIHVSFEENYYKGNDG